MQGQLLGIRRCPWPLSAHRRFFRSNKRARLAAPNQAFSPELARTASSSSGSVSLSAASDVSPPRFATSSSPVANSSRKTTKVCLLGRRDGRKTGASKQSKPASKRKTGAKLGQMHLAVSSKPISKTCASCGMAYIRGAVEDEELHRIYCRKLSKGIECNFSAGDADCTTLAENIWVGKGIDQISGRIVMVEAGADRTARKVR